MGLFDLLANLLGVDNTRKRREQHTRSSSITRGKFQTPPRQAGKQPTPSPYHRTHHRPPMIPPMTAKRLEHIASAYATLHASFSEIDDIHDPVTLDHLMDHIEMTMRNVFQQDYETHHAFSAHGCFEYLNQIDKIHRAQDQSVEQKKSALVKLDQEIREECAVNIGYRLVNQDDPKEYSSKIMSLRGNQYLQQRGL